MLVKFKQSYNFKMIRMMRIYLSHVLYTTLIPHIFSPCIVHNREIIKVVIPISDLFNSMVVHSFVVLFCFFFSFYKFCQFIWILSKHVLLENQTITQIKVLNIHFGIIHLYFFLNCIHFAYVILMLT